MLAYLTIFSASIAGFASAPAWVILLASIALVSLSFAEHYRLYQRNSGLGMTELVDTTLLGSLINALVASSLAFGAGVALRIFGAA
jgi:hypothetical protein